MLSISTKYYCTYIQGLTEETVYTWNFGDKTDEVKIEGLEETSTQVHTYASGGHYTVRVTASNEGGMSSVSIDLTIGSKRASVCRPFPLTPYPP